MKSTHSRILTILLAAVLVAFGANLAAYAANGGPLLLGKSNKATKTTKLKNSKGTALSLKSKTGTAPFAVSNSTTVAKLSADLLDGKDSTALVNKSFVFNLTAPTQTQPYVFFSLAGLPAGKYVFNYDVTMTVTGAPSFVACFLISAVGVTSVANAVAATSDGGGYYASSSGYVDTTSQAYRFGCQKGGGTDLTIPSNPIFPAQIVFTRVDDVTVGGLAGAASVAPKGGVAGRK